MRILLTLVLVCLLLQSCAEPKVAGNQLSITVENNKKGAPITLGIPFPKGELNSVDHIRLLTSDGTEIPCQTTEVSTWGPIDDSIKWVWVFFFSEETTDYVLEYGEGVVPMRPTEKIISANNMRPSGGIEVNTGAISFNIHKKGDGFLDEVFLDSNNDGEFSEKELISWLLSERLDFMASQ